MVQANELRIGNWVMWQTVPMKIMTPTILQRTFSKIEEGRVYPILLTPEILEKAGFEKYNNSPNETGYIIEKIRPEKTIYIRTGNVFHTGIFFSIFNQSACKRKEINYIRQVQYLHELQNLYFAITGEELQINL